MAKKEEIKAIENLYNAVKEKNKNSYENAFKESIMNYFYKLYELERKHLYYIAEINDFILENNYEEEFLNIEEFSYYFNKEDNYDNNKQDELSELLYCFYKSIGGKEENKIFREKNVNENFYESNKYESYKNEQGAFEKVKAKIKKLNYLTL